MTISEKAAYLKGLAEGMGLNEAEVKDRMILKLLDLTVDMAESIEALETRCNDLADYADELDSDLGDVEEYLFVDEDEEYEDEDDEDYEDEDGQTWLLSLDGYELELGEKRIYDFSTARVVRPGNKSFVNIEIESYPESSPDKRETGTISMVKQDDGKWYLDSFTG